MKELYLFELQYRFRRPATWIYIFLGFAMAFLTSVFEKSGTAEFVNSPSTIATSLATLSVLSIFFYAAIMGVPIYRDQDHKTAQTYFTLPISEKSYVLGRFLGSFTVTTLLNLAMLLGLIAGFTIGMVLNRPDYGTYTSFSPTSYLLPFFAFLEVNAFLVGALFFTLMAAFKKMPLIYLGGISLFILYTISGTLLSDLDSQWISVYLDPFGSRALRYITKYWSINELNTNELPLHGPFLLNRLLWFGVGILLFLVTLFRFRYKRFLLGGKKKTSTDTTVYHPQGTVIFQQYFGRKAELQKFLSLAKIEFLSILKDPIFLILLVIGVSISIFTIHSANETYGTPNLPLTRYVILLISGGITLLSVIILIIYSGEAVHRTRNNKTFVFYDALPIKNKTLYLSKVLSLFSVAGVLVLVNILVGCIYQISQGYFGFEIGMALLYNTVVTLPIFLMTILLAFFVHVLVNNKFLGHFIVIVLYVGLPLLVAFVFKNNNPMWSFANTPPLFLSDLNGFGHYLPGIIWLNLYWILLTVLLAGIGYLFWIRGFYASFGERLRIAKQRMSPGVGVLFASVLLLFISVAGYSYYNLNVLNTSYSSDELEEIAADAEKKYAKYIGKPHPQVTGLKAYIDIYPNKRKVRARGTYTIENKYAERIDTLYLEIQYPLNEVRLEKVVYNQTELQPVHSDAEYRVYLYKLPQALQPGEAADLNLEVIAEAKGFANQLETGVLYNGSFFRDDIFPRFHYKRELTDNGVRKKYGLEELDFLYPKRTDSSALRKNLFNEDADYIDFEATISTTEDQIALAPGVLESSWKKNGRAFYRYTLEEKTDLFFNVVSARYDVEKSVWKAPSGKEVMIEVYHSPKHKRNLSYFIKGAKVALDYCSDNFLEYPYSVLRIVEFPAHSTFAQSFATTIPYSEDFGFAADFDKAEDFNYAFRVTTHEVAHQWWGHIVTPSYTSGANIISETLAEYTSLMTMKHEYGENGIKNFLKYSLDRYLRGRSGSTKPERTLVDVEIGPHIWYEKGSMVMYELQDIIGEAKVNAALKAFLEEYKYLKKGVYPTSENLYQALKKVTPDSLQYVVDDGFTKIVLYENRVVSAVTKPLNGEGYETTLTVDSKKIYYDDKGREERTGQTPNYIEIGVFGEDITDEKEVTLKNPYDLRRRLVKPGKNTFVIYTKEKPVKAGIDPYNKLIDRNSDDNLKRVEEE